VISKPLATIEAADIQRLIDEGIYEEDARGWCSGVLQVNRSEVMRGDEKSQSRGLAGAHCTHV
jgi:hypothetical protein